MVKAEIAGLAQVGGRRAATQEAYGRSDSDDGVLRRE
jgi:hypothetical protein